MSRRAAVEEAIADLFSDEHRNLTDIAQKAKELSEMQGVGLFLTGLTWNLRFDDGQNISGTSEDLRSAATDIHNWLQYVSPKRAGDARGRLALVGAA
ncbi:MAG TPA: hypothetical protein VFR09_00045 [Alphaproteobacteria bacterium]|nr:hypothetical protein [Alphaproteobacteria bacterium]